MSKRKLLLADDSVTIQKVVNLTFADEGIEVITVGDGDSAIDKFFELSPDLVMADVNMPGLNGYQVCEKIRQESSNPNTPVILLVGSFEPFDEEEARRVGADDHLTKPFQSIRQLVNKVTVLLNSTSEGATAKLPPTVSEVSSIDDTLEMNKQDESETPVQFTDNGYDDEMIQSNPMSSYSLDESQKFETKATTESEIDYSMTQPLTRDEIKDFDLIDSAASSDVDYSVTETVRTISREELEYGEAVSEDIHDTADAVAEEVANEEVETENSVEESTDEETQIVETEATESDEEMPLPEAASVLQLDEANPLELPPIESDSEAQNIVIDTDEASNLVSIPTTETTEPTSEITPDLIETIVQKVMERLSDKAVREIAWEVVPETAERIVKQMAEENLKK